MSQENSLNPEKGQYHLKKVLIESVPFAGKVLKEILYEWPEAEIKAQEKKALAAKWDTLLQQQQAQNTDLGDILRKLETLEAGQGFVQKVFQAFHAYLEARADEQTILRVEAAASRALPATDPDIVETTMHETPITTDEVITVLGELHSADFEQLVVIFNAGDHVAKFVANAQRWAELAAFAEKSHRLQDLYQRAQAIKPNPR